MVKKLFFISLLSGSVGLNIYLLNTLVVSHDDLDSDMIEMDDKISIAQSAIRKPYSTSERKRDKNKKSIRKSFLPESHNGSENKKEQAESTIDNEVEQDVTYINSNYDLGMDKWQKRLVDKLEGELALSTDTVDQYFQIRKERQDAIDSYMQPQFDNLPDGESLLVSIEDNIQISKINEFYLNKLKDSLGSEAYKSYKKVRENFNKESLQPNSDHFYIEF